MNPDEMKMMARKELARRELARREQNPTAQFDAKKEQLLLQDPTAKAFLNVDQRIEKRGYLPTQIFENLKSPSKVQKGIGILQTVGAPFQAMESAIANPMIAIQRGENSPVKLLQESSKGFTFEKPGEFGDVFRGAGVSEPLSATAGLTLGVGAPMKAARNITKELGNIAKGTDKTILKAGDDLVRSTVEAKDFVGNKVNQAFAKVDQVPVDSNQYLEAVGKLPNPLIKVLEEEVGNLDQLPMTVGTMRKVKQVIGKYRPSLFGKEDRGLADTIEGEAINKSYGKLKQIITDSVTKSAGKKDADNLLKLDEEFSKVARASDSIKKATVDPTLRQATKGGNVAAKMAKEGDVTTRQALNAIRDAGPQARRSVNDAVDRLNRFTRHQNIFKNLKRVGDATIFGGAAGAIGGTLGANLLNRDKRAQ